jgi:hypothetical protein
MPDLPQPLPPAERTVGQLVAETIRAYGANFWRALPLGIPIAVVDQLSIRQPAETQMLIYWAATPFLAGAYVYACSIVHRNSPTRTAICVALLVYLPFPALRAIFILPGLAWFAYIGLAVPAAMLERLPFGEALRRGRRLGAADYVHALGSIAALVVVVGVAEESLRVVLQTQGDNGERAALFVSGLILSPLLYLGGALLYTDQAARVGSGRPHRRSRRDADLHPPLDADATGRPDPQVES